MKKFILGGAFLFTVLVLPLSQAQASNLTNTQIQAILAILSSFGADSATIASVNSALTGGPSTTSSSPAFCFRVTSNLTIGSRGSSVLQLNQALANSGIDTSDNSDVFDENTAADVVQFQARYGIRQTGYVGPATRARLTTLYRCPTPQTTTTNSGSSVGGSGNAAVSITSPAGGETWSQNTQQTIRWSLRDLNGNERYVVSFLSSTGALCDYAEGLASGSASVSVIPSSAGCSNNHNMNLRGGGTYRVLISIVNPSGNRIASATSNSFALLPSDLTITNVTYSPSSPHVNDWITTTVTVKNNLSTDWTTPFQVNVQGTTVTVPSLDAGESTTVTAPNAFTFSYPGTQTLNTAIIYPIAGSSGSGNTGHSFTNTLTFTSVTPTPTPAPTPTPTVTVVSPNGGENWYRGQTYLVTWRSANVPSSDDQVLIRLRSGSTGREYDLATTRNDGAHSITIPTTVPEGTYTLEIKTTVAGHMDGSDSSFEIDDRTTETPTGTLSFSQSAFNFSYTQNGNIPSNQSLTFENTSGTNVNYTISVPNQPSWLNTSYNTSMRTSYPGRDTGLGASVNPAGLTSGVYVTNIVLTGNFTGSPKTIPVTLTVIAPSAVQTVAPVITLTVNGSAYNGTSYNVAFGGTANIGWNVTPTSGTVCAAAGNGVWGTAGSGSVTMSGSWTTPNLYTNTTYGIVCTNNAGTTYKYVTIGVQAQTNTTTSGNSAPIITLNGSSNSSTLNLNVAFGGTVTFRWSVTQPSGSVTTCNAAGTGIGDPSRYGNMALSGSWTTPRLYTTVTYGMACTNTNAAGVASGTTYKYAKVTVAEQTSTVTPEPTPAARCSAQTITWSGTGSGCSGSISEAGSGSYANVNNTVEGKKGSARFDCNNGTWTKNEASSSCINYCSADGALFSPATVREKDGARSSCQSPGYSWQTPSWVGSGTLSSGFCAYSSYNYANDTLGVLNGQCYNCSVGSWVPITSSYCRKY